MANTKQAQKAVRKTKKRTNYNKWWKNQIKTAYKSVLSLLNSDDTEKKAEAVVVFQKKLDKSVKTKVLHKNRANRMKSTLMKKASAKAK